MKTKNNMTVFFISLQGIKQSFNELKEKKHINYSVSL